MSIRPLLSRSPRRSWRLALTTFLAALALLAFAGFIRTAAQGVEMVHFTNCAFETGYDATVIIPAGAPQIHTAGYFQPTPGDEFAVFRPTGTLPGTCDATIQTLCTGAVVWTGAANQALVVYGDDDQTGPIDGMRSGERMCWQVWDASDDKVYTATVVYDSTPPFNPSGLYTTDGWFRLSTLSPTALKLTAFQAVSRAVWDHRSALLAGCALLLAAAGLLVAIKLLPRRQRA